MTDNTCTTPGCTRRAQARKLCSSHYSIWYKQGKARDQYRPRYAITCTTCGATHQSTRKDGKYCSLTCRDLARKAAPRKPKQARYEQPKLPLHLAKDRRGPLRRALEDRVGVIPAVRGMAETDAHGCWIWQGRIDRSGYPVQACGSRRIAVHRAVLESKHGKPLGTQAAHHKCGNTKCVNPDHLQPVTHRENTAEMLARNYLENRIKELEEALSILNPNHPLLKEIGLMEAS